MTVKKPATRILLSIGVWLAFFNVSHAEIIESFTSDIELADDGSFTVTETIVYDFEGAERHGIYRNIRNSHAQPATAWYKTRYIDLDLQSVTMDGGSVPYVIEPYDGLSVRIGDANKTITGTHTYKIVYDVDGAIAIYDDGLTELYWNVTGDEWNVPILRTVTNVYTGTDVLDEAQACYVSGDDSHERCFAVKMTVQSKFESGTLNPYEQFTIAQALQLPDAPRIIERIDWFWLWLIGCAVWFISLGIWAYRRKTFYKPKAPIIAQYEPLPDFKPMFTGVLFDGRLDSRDISAGIVYLAEQGFISIKKTEEKVLGLFNTTDYEITLKRPMTETETNFQGELLQLMFDVGDAPGKISKLSALRKNNSKLRKNAVLLQKLQSAVIDDLHEREYFEPKEYNRFKLLIPLGIGILFIALFFFASIPFVVPTAIFCAVSAIFIAIGIDRRTKKGYEALFHLKGFKEFLSVTDKERFEFHNAPEKSPEQFMEYLPYAIAFGVEKKWTKLFEDIQIAQPDWYSSADGTTTFNALAFTNELGAFTGAFSTSSGSSGSSGGGSAGGGSGGGGGGSW